MENFERYFIGEKKVFLDNISYESASVAPGTEKMNLSCKDTVVAQLAEHGVKITFNRALKFSSEGPFFLSLTFGVMLVFNPQTKNEVDWRGVDIAGEFRRSCPGLMSVLMSRTSLLVAEITSAAGQNPLITPAQPVPEGGNIQ